MAIHPQIGVLLGGDHYHAFVSLASHSDGKYVWIRLMWKNGITLFFNHYKLMVLIGMKKVMMMV